MKDTKGSLIIETSLALTLFIIFFMTFLSLARYSVVQNKVKHSINQTAIEMSLRNQMLSSIGEDLSFIIGQNYEGISDLISKFNSNAAENNAKNGAPYSSDNWSDEDLKLEVLRFFASNYLDINFDDTTDKTAMIKSLENEGIINIKIEGGEDGKLISKTINGHSELNIKITYNINTGFSFHTFFGINANPEFTDSIKFPLLS